MCGRGGMADAPDLGSGGATRGGSSPLARTIYRQNKPNLNGFAAYGHLGGQFSEKQPERFRLLFI